MISLPYNKRPYDVFISYSHSERDFVQNLVKWLKDISGLNIWCDFNQLKSGDKLSSALPQGISNSRASLFCVSNSWIQSTWCEDEFNAALQERRANRRYRIIALKIEDCEIPRFLSNARYFEVQTLDENTACLLLESLNPGSSTWSHGKRDVYISRSWHDSDLETADILCKALSDNYAFRLIGDSPDYAAFEENDRIKGLIESCGALIAILPYRNSSKYGFTSKWILKEIQIAKELKIPFMLFGADKVKVDPSILDYSIGQEIYQLPSSSNDALINNALFLFEEEYVPSPKQAYSFFATSLRNDSYDANRSIALIEQMTNMKCQMGLRLQGQHAQKEIVELIRNAQFVLADITSNNLNSIIEAGIARGAGTNLHLISKIPDSGDLRTRFMFRDLEINWYKDSVERIGVIHRIVRMYRRRVY